MQSMPREFGTFFAIVHPVLFCCTFTRVSSYERIFVLRIHIIRMGADSTCHNQKEMKVVGEYYRLLLLLSLPLQHTMYFSLLSDFLPFHPFLAPF
jgi:hypothetical protein